jgi:pSer/pThr/pTyr-binding forkhead associated (FHA) protein
MGAEMALTIVVLSAESDPLPSITFDSPRVVIGRGEGADVRLPDSSVSHRHATLRQRGSDYLIVDEGSTNGTLIGSDHGMVRLSPQSPRVIRSGERVRVGRIELELRIEHGAPVTESPLATRELALQLVSAALAAQGEQLAGRLQATAPDGQKSDISLAELGHEYVIGRGAGTDLRVDDADCSRRHVGVTRRGNGVFVRDLGSKNGSKLDDDPVPKDGEARWLPGKKLSLGGTVLVYDDPTADILEELESAADERVSVDPPRANRAPEPAVSTETSEGPAPRERAAPEARAAARESTPKRPLDPRVSDLLVGLLALLVLGLSALGLYWLFTSR